MQCLEPITITIRDRYGSIRKKGINSAKLDAMRIMYPDKTDNELISMLYPASRTVPCGKCAACLSNRRTAWVSRLSYELFHSSNSHFFTLTFDDDHLVYDIKERKPVALLDFVSKFMENVKSKLFRKQKNPLKYFVVSEYGPKTQRPHFHMLLFNLPLSVDLRTIENLWYHGNIKVDTINGARIGYVTKYCLSKIDPDLWCIDDAGYRPQMRCSKNLGAGLLDDPTLVRQYRVSLLNDGYISNDKFRVPVSRYYKDRLFDAYERTFVSEKSQEYSRDHNIKMMSKDNKYRLEFKDKAARLNYKVNKSIKKSQI